MLKKALLLTVVLRTIAAMAATQPLHLGVNYSELLPTGALPQVDQMATSTDPQGNIYILAADNGSQYVYNMLKLAPGGDTVVYQNQFTVNPATPAYVQLLAVDPAGNVYLSLNSQTVEKLSPDGQTVEYAANIGSNGVYVSAFVVDASGRACMTGTASGSGIQTTAGAFQPEPAAPGASAFVICLKPSGAVDYATYLGGSSSANPSALAVDVSGSVFVTGFAGSDFPTTPNAYLAASALPPFSSPAFLARLSADGARLIYSTFVIAQDYVPCCVTVDSSDNAAVAFENSRRTLATVERFNAQGTALLFSRTVPASSVTGLATNTAGNTYFEVDTVSNYPVLNSVAQCSPGTNGALIVLDGQGNTLQSTYIPGSFAGLQVGTTGVSAQLAIQVGADSTVYVVGSPSASYVPTRQLSGSPAGLLFLTALTQTANAPVFQLACVANAASYDNAGISAGEIVSLFGQGLGPAQAAQPAVDAVAGFPKQLADVQVTFNGIPGPLLYVQDNQVNAIAPVVLDASQAVNVCVVYNGAAPYCLTQPVLADHPGVFTLDGTYAAALNQDGTINTASNPAEVGSVVSIFATGLGATNPFETDGALVGLPLPVDVYMSQVSWTCTLQTSGGFPPQTYIINTDVKYAGPAPFEVAGLSQVNFVVQTTTPDCGIGGEPPSPLFLQQSGAAQVSNGFVVHVAGQAPLQP